MRRKKAESICVLRLQPNKSNAYKTLDLDLKVSKPTLENGLNGTTIFTEYLVKWFKKAKSRMKKTLPTQWAVAQASTARSPSLSVCPSCKTLTLNGGKTHSRQLYTPSIPFSSSFTVFFSQHTYSIHISSEDQKFICRLAGMLCADC